MTIENLLGGIPATRLPVDPALDELIEHGSEEFVGIAARHLDSSLCWAILSEGSLAARSADAELIAYAFARTGYHRGLDTLRRNGWKGSGPIPWEHEPNRGFLRCLAMLATVSERLGDDEERDRCWQFLRDSSETGYHFMRARVAEGASPVADLVRDITEADEREGEIEAADLPDEAASQDADEPEEHNGAQESHDSESSADSDEPEDDSPDRDSAEPDKAAE